MNDITIDNAGVALAASVYGRPELPPVLLMHGISNSRDVWYDWAVELSDRYRVYALDCRGHGHSARAHCGNIKGQLHAERLWLGIVDH